MVELQRMRWYNPKGGSFEWREVPKSDEDALSLLSYCPHTQSCTDTYLYWRKLDASITAALLRVSEQALEEERSQEAIASMGKISAGKRISVWASEKGKLVVRRGRKA